MSGEFMFDLSGLSVSLAGLTSGASSMAAACATGVCHAISSGAAGISGQVANVGLGLGSLAPSAIAEALPAGKGMGAAIA